MKACLLVILIGLVAAFVGIVPLLKRRADRYMLFSVFLFYFLMPYVVYHIKLPGINEWFTGPVVTLMLVLPLVIAQGKDIKNVYSRCCSQLSALVFSLLLWDISW